MFLILETAGAKLTIAEGPNKATVISVADYLYLNMDKKIILNVILPALDPKVYTYRSYKVMVNRMSIKIVSKLLIYLFLFRLCLELKTLTHT